MVKSSRLCCISGTGCFRGQVAHDSGENPVGRMSMKHLLAGSLMAASVVSLATSAALAKDKTTPASPLVAAIDRCRQITDPTQRLACFDGAANALVKATASGDVSVVDRGEVRKVRHSLFGFSLPKVPFFAG